MSLRIVIVGSGGRLGAALARQWGALGDEIIGFNHASLDLADDGELRAKLGALEFDVLVNCAAQTNVDRCETHPDEAQRLNAGAVRTIAEICAAKQRRCVHISTDYVFDGAQTRPYTEEDPALPISVYGQSKRDGEVALLAVNDRHLAVRVSWVFGPDRPSFVDGILKRAFESEQVDAIGDKVAVPTYTIDAAQLLYPLLAEHPVGGLLHLSNAGQCTWQEYGQHAIDCAVAAGVPMLGLTVAALKMADLKAFIAKRPVYTALSTEKLSRLTGSQPRDWKAAVQEYVEAYWAPSRRS